MLNNILADNAVLPLSGKAETSLVLSDCVIATSITRTYYPEVLEFEISCKPAGDDGRAIDGQAIATLEGFIHYAGQLPDDRHFHIYDGRSSHCEDALRIMNEKRRAIARALPGADLDWIDAVVFLERAWVSEENRGQALAHRLMREAKHVFARPEVFVILKAHPDGENVSQQACRKLAAYYCSDPELNFNPVSTKQEPGWLVGVWSV